MLPSGATGGKLPDIEEFTSGQVQKKLVQSDFEGGAQTTHKFEAASRRWVEIFASGAQALAAGGTTDYSSPQIEVWQFDQIMVEFRLVGTMDDADILITPVDSEGNTVGYYLIMDADNGGVDDIKAIFAQTAIDPSAADVYAVMVIDKFVGLHSITVQLENDDAVNAGTAYATVYGRRF